MAENRQPEPVWRLRATDHWIEAFLYDHGGYGVECRLRHDGEFFYSHRLNFRRDAVAEATALRQIFESNGWKPLDASSPSAADRSGR
jgi:hypothetical protein